MAVSGKKGQNGKESSGNGVVKNRFVGTLIFLWTSLMVSLYVVPNLWVRIILLVVGVIVTIHIALIHAFATLRHARPEP
jgi:uncharacterized membrane protein YbaN (DUF454 family)